MSLLDVLSTWRADRRIRKLLRDARSRPLDHLPEDEFVRVTGIVQPHHARVLEAPLSGRLCAYYSVVIRASGSARQRGRVHTVFEEDEAVTFELESGASRVIVDPTDAWISCAFDRDADLGDARARALLERAGLRGRVDRPRFQEAILGVGERVAVFGAAVQEIDRARVDAEQGYRDHAPTRARFTGTPRFPLVIRDDVNDVTAR